MHVHKRENNNNKVNTKVREALSRSFSRTSTYSVFCSSAAIFLHLQYNQYIKAACAKAGEQKQGEHARRRNPISKQGLQGLDSYMQTVLLVSTLIQQKR